MTYFEAKALQKKMVFSDGPGSFHPAVQIPRHFGAKISVSQGGLTEVTNDIKVYPRLQVSMVSIRNAGQHSGLTAYRLCIIYIYIHV